MPQNVVPNRSVIRRAECVQIRQGLWDLCLIGSNGWKLEVVTVRRLWFPV